MASSAGAALIFRWGLIDGAEIGAVTRPVERVVSSTSIDPSPMNGTKTGSVHGKLTDRTYKRPVTRLK
jgi:hypothetical protein